MAAVILKDPDMVGITDSKRRAILEAERMAGALGILPDDKEKRAYVIEQLQRRLARAGKGWDWEFEETVVRVDDNGVPRIIPKSQAVGWMRGLPASPDTYDRTSHTARTGRTRPLEKDFDFKDPGAIKPVQPRVAAERFYARIRSEIERSGYIPQALRLELWEAGWRVGHPIPLDKVEQWCKEFTARAAKS